MTSTGEKVRFLMDRRGVSVAELATSSGISESQIKNIIYNRSKKPEFLSRIAESMEVSYESLKDSIKSSQVMLDNYQNASEIVILILKQNNIASLDSAMLENFIEKTYKQLTEGATYESCSHYIRGVIETNIQTGNLKRNA